MHAVEGDPLAERPQEHAHAPAVPRAQRDGVAVEKLRHVGQGAVMRFFFILIQNCTIKDTPQPQNAGASCDWLPLAEDQYCSCGHGHMNTLAVPGAVTDP